MDNKEKEMMKDHNKVMKKILKSAFYTFLIFILSMWGIYSIFGLLFNMSVEQSNVYAIISFCLGIVFTIFYCTFTIIEEIRNSIKK